jgi:hypothetical protein
MNTCKSCEYFYSYEDIYEDNLEPYDIGECHIDNVYPVPSDKCGVKWEDSCENYTRY